MSCHNFDSPLAVQILLNAGADANVAGNVRMKKVIVHILAFDGVPWHTFQSWYNCTSLCTLCIHYCVCCS